MGQAGSAAAACHSSIFSLHHCVVHWIFLKWRVNLQMKGVIKGMGVTLKGRYGGTRRYRTDILRFPLVLARIRFRGSPVFWSEKCIVWQPYAHVFVLRIALPLRSETKAKSTDPNRSDRFCMTLISKSLYFAVHDFMYAEVCPTGRPFVMTKRQFRASYPLRWIVLRTKRG